MQNFFNNSRRRFIKTAAVGTAAGLSIPQLVSADVTSAKSARLNINDVILFQGDSITDWGRDHKAIQPNTTSMLGSGYTILAAAELLMKHPDKNFKIYNRGIAGNKVYQLAERWDADCIALKPNVVSIHIGVNDYWHTLLNGYKGTVETYTADYKTLIERTQKALPGVKIIICEPFALKGTKAVTGAWYPTFDLFRKAAKDLADQYDLPFVAYQAAFDKAMQKGGDANYWTIDGVHPSVAGEKLMAQTWLEAVKG
ncbi:SGNH/GDSL hydrolase family protein [Mucilaginibacter glaciei]|uniref:SGNH/GDSL hydrolase family protein n=1 Tax=Mucilaginibacter glaciei TaxID=2772109 RepID=A0A926S1K9_9SPHI|nr:SGNH/GDSL hydrolase family protein [Mucilaginibacter glaciei]MBD1393188.1 SGNH/GDSL hydrolase family protein [Mucilaginibacter glaciei]